MAGLGIGLAVGLGPPSDGGGAAAPNPNLLRWTEEFDNAVWVNGGYSISVDSATDPLGGQTADVLTFSAGGLIRQVSQAAVSSGASAGSSAVLTGGWGRYSVTGSYDGLQYCFSIYLSGDVGVGVILNLQVVAGFIQAMVFDGDETGPVVAFWGAKLEQAGSPSDYNHRTI